MSRNQRFLSFSDALLLFLISLCSQPGGDTTSFQPGSQVSSQVLTLGEFSQDGGSGEGGGTSDDELLAVDARVPLGALQQGDPVVHLLWRVGVAVQHAVGRDDDEGVGPERQ